MATAVEVYNSVRTAHELAAELAGVPTIASLEIALANEQSLRAALEAKLEIARTEVDEVILEAQDARTKLG